MTRPDLGEFLRQSAARRREPGVWDCCTFPAAWAIANGCPDPMADWRGRYHTEAQALDLIADGGGLADLFTRGFSGAGVSPVEGPFRAGDIGVVQLLGEQAGAVYTGKRWALVADRGMAFASIASEHIVRAWRVENG